MFLCPVCSFEYSDRNPPENCQVCGWDLTDGKSEIDKKRLEWAQETWRKLQDLQSKVSNKPKKKRVTVADLLPKIQNIESELEASKIERENLQNQLEWVLYYLETINPERLTETVSRLDGWLERTETENPPLSEVGMDYTPLMELLAAGDWKAADEYTWQILLYVMGREGEGWLTGEDIGQFPATDLRTIAYYWEYYSGGLFGLKMQREIWESADRDYGQFCDRVGWRDGDNWKYYEELQFNLNAPPGHLPVFAWRRRACYGVGTGTAAEGLSLWMNLTVVVAL
jgi:hypothetical protein